MLLFVPRSLCALKRVAAKAEHSRFGATQGTSADNTGVSQDMLKVLLTSMQNDLRKDPEMCSSLSGSGHFALVEPLTCEQIDTLCERLNAIGFAKHREEDPDCTCPDCRTWNERWTPAK